jgi:hypothetical protein
VTGVCLSAAFGEQQAAAPKWRFLCDTLAHRADMFRTGGQAGAGSNFSSPLFLPYRNLQFTTPETWLRFAEWLREPDKALPRRTPRY